MTLAEILAWKFNNAEGIRTRILEDGSEVIFDWPEKTLGPEPTQTQIDQWRIDYIAVEADLKAKAEMSETYIDELFIDLFVDIYGWGTALNGGTNPSLIPELKATTTDAEIRDAITALYKMKRGS